MGFESGYNIVEGRLSPNELAEVRAAIDPLIETSTNGHDDFEGFETCRLGAMLSHTEAVKLLSLMSTPQQPSCT